MWCGPHRRFHQLQNTLMPTGDGPALPSSDGRASSGTGRQSIVRVMTLIGIALSLVRSPAEGEAHTDIPRGRKRLVTVYWTERNATVAADVRKSSITANVSLSASGKETVRVSESSPQCAALVST